MKPAGGHEIGKELQHLFWPSLFWQQLLSLHYHIFAIYFSELWLKQCLKFKSNKQEGKMKFMQRLETRIRRSPSDQMSFVHMDLFRCWLNLVFLLQQSITYSGVQSHRFDKGSEEKTSITLFITSKIQR